MPQKCPQCGRPASEGDAEWIAQNGECLLCDKVRGKIAEDERN